MFIKVSCYYSWQYLLDVSELEDWMKETWPLVSSQDYGGDEAATVRLIAKHQVPCPKYAPHCLDLGADGPRGKGLTPTPRALPTSRRHRALLFLPEDTASPFPTTQPILQGPCLSLVLPFFRSNPFEGPLPPLTSPHPWPRDFSAFSPGFLSSCGHLSTLSGLLFQPSPCLPQGSSSHAWSIIL